MMKTKERGFKEGLFFQAVKWVVVILIALGMPVKAQDKKEAKASEDGKEDMVKAWPKEIKAEKGVIVIYQPQVEAFDGNSLSARSAVSVEMNEVMEGEKKGPVFGVIWMAAKVETDREERMVNIRSLSIPRVRFAGSTAAQEAKLADIIEAEVPKWNHEISLDRVLASLALVEDEKKGAANLEMAPPKIIYSKTPAVLVTIDGEPQLNIMEGSTDLMRVINTPFLIVFDATLKKYFLYAGKDAWYSAVALEAAWSIEEAVPKKVADLAPDESDMELSESDEGAKGTVPKLYVVTEPTELIYTDGEPAFTPISGTGIMFVSNSDSSLFMDMSKRTYYVLLSGRWFKGKNLNGPWQYVASNKLPADFKRIPEDSDVGDVRSFVYGTEEAAEAVLDAQIPQTAKVSRGDVKVEVSYDGDPQFAAIPGTELQYAVNTGSQVLQEGDHYYACDAGVWYVSASPLGPWQVAEVRPEGVDDIPPESPLYNVKYVYIYDSTPEYVYVGYTPGYTGCYVYGGVLVYGTGYRYRPWWRRGIYYGRPVTYGYAMRWNRWSSGWSYGVVYSNGRFTFGMGYGRWGRWHGGVWGAGFYNGYWRGHSRGFYRGLHRGYYQGYRAAQLDRLASARPGQPRRYPGADLYRNYQRAGVASYRKSVRPVTKPGQLPTRPGVKPGTRPSKLIAKPGSPTTKPAIPGKPSQPVAKPGVPSTRPAVPTLPSTRPATPSPSIALDRANNVYADKAGNVYQRLPNGSWNHLADGRPTSRPVTTRPAVPTTRPTTPVTRPVTTRPAVPTTRPTTRPTAPTTRPVTTRPTTRPSSTITPSQRSSLNSSYQSRQTGSTRTSQSSRSRSSASRSRSSGRSRGGGGGRRR